MTAQHVAHLGQPPVAMLVGEAAACKGSEWGTLFSSSQSGVQMLVCLNVELLAGPHLGKAGTARRAKTMQ